MLAVFGVIIMVAFVFGDPIVRIIGRGREVADNPVVVETQYGSLKQSDLNALIDSRNIAQVFLQRLAAATIDAVIDKGQLDKRDRDPIIMNYYQRWHRILLGRSKLGREQSALETMVLARRATEQGMVVDNEAINDVIRKITENSVPSETITRLIETLFHGRKLSPERVFDALRTEMLASNYRDLFSEAISDVTPAQRFEYYLRLNRKAKAEVMPVAVADFTSQVPDPSAEELKSLFEQYKERYPDPASSEPGFKQPKRAAFQYFKVNYAQLIDQYKAQVTEEEIQKYYDANKSQYRSIELPETDAESKNEADEPKEPSGDSAEKPADETPADEKPADEQPTDKEPADAKPTSEKPTPADEKKPQSGRERDSRFRLVSATEQKAATEQAAEPAAAPNEKPAAEPTAVDKKPKPADSEAKDTPAPSEGAKDDAAKPDDAGKPDDAAKTEGEGEPEVEAAKPGADIKYDPIEKVHDNIRDALAGRKANERIGEIFNELKPEMDRYANDLERHNLRKETDKSAIAPPPFDFATLAKKYGLEAKQLPLVTATEAASEDIGEASKLDNESRRL